MRMYIVYKKIGWIRHWMAACSDIEEASRVIRADAQICRTGCVYEIELEEGVPA